MIAHSCNPSTQKDEAGGLLQVQDHHELHNEFKAVQCGESLGWVGTVLGGDKKEKGRKRNRGRKEGKRKEGRLFQ